MCCKRLTKCLTNPDTTIVCFRHTCSDRCIAKIAKEKTNEKNYLQATMEHGRRVNDNGLAYTTPPTAMFNNRSSTRNAPVLGTAVTIAFFYKHNIIRHLPINNQIMLIKHTVAICSARNRRLVSHLDHME